MANNSEHKRSPRFTYWAALVVASAVSLGSITSRENGSKSRREKWAISVTSVSLSLAFLSFFAHMVASDKFVGTKSEGAVSFLILLMWAGGLPVIMDPSNDLAVTDLVVTNSNLYFFSWGAVACVLFICGHYTQKVLQAYDFSSTPPKIAKWYMLTAASIVLLSASSKYHNTLNCTNNTISDTEICMRNKYAICLGGIGSLTGLVFVAMASRGKVTVKWEAGLALTLFIMYCFGVGFITFGEGPGTFIGNLYFSTWIGFSVGVFLSTDCVHEVIHEWKEGSPAIPPPSEPTSQPEIKIGDSKHDEESALETEIKASDSNHDEESAVETEPEIKVSDSHHDEEAAVGTLDEIKLSNSNHDEESAV